VTGRILLVEDDEKLGKQISEHLGGARFEVTWLRDGADALVADTKSVSLVVLDLMLPGASGLDVLARIREHSGVPVLVLSAKSDAEVKVRALEIGADDYLTKPFWPEELLARVRARLRRPQLENASAGDKIEVGPIAIDVAGHTARLSGRPLDLTRVEFDLLCALARRAGSAVGRKWLVDHVLDPRRQGDERTLDVHVFRLRKKLGDAGDRLSTVWGVGYRLRGDEPAGHDPK
jgi:two-component system response regulator MtrA